MAREIVEYTELSNFEGRNGFFKCSGLKIIRISSDTEIYIYPTTSKGRTGRGMIGVPIADIDKVIEALTKIKNNEQHNKQTD